MKTINTNKIKDFLNKDITSTKIDSRILSLFLKQLSLLIASGIAFDESLRIIENQKIDKKLTTALHNINMDLSAGFSVYEAFLHNNKYFDPMFLAFIKSGDRSGKLAEILDELSSYINEDSKNKAAMKAALTYPIILLVVTIAIVTIITTFVLPTFATVFKETGQSLPVMTRILLGIANFFDEYGLLVLIIGACIIMSFLIMRKDNDFRFSSDRWMFLNLPFKKFRILKFEYQFTSLLYILRTGDIDIIDSLIIISDSFNNLYLKDLLDEIISDLSRGERLSVSLSSKPIFTPLFISMIKIGEDSGNMTDSLKKTSEYYANDYVFRLKKMAQLAEPVTIIIMSLLVGFVVFAIAIPIFDSVNSVTY